MSSSTTTLKAFRLGTDRAVSPAETLATLTPLLAGLGITRVADVTGMDCIGIPTVMVVRPNSRSVSVSQGKGADLVSAKVSGIMESIEQFHAEHVVQPLRLGSLPEMRAVSAVVDVRALPGFVREYEEAQRILWIAGEDVVTGETTLVPFEAVHLDLRLPLPSGSGYFMSGSNGLASGNNRQEALSHGLCELIERDALSLFFQLNASDQSARRVDLGSIDDSICLELLARYRRAEMDVAVWDMTSDLGIPCFLCWVLEAKDDTFRPVGLAQGSGCHPRRGIALSRALSEAAQSRVTRIVGSRDDVHPRHLRELRAADALARHRQQMATLPKRCRLFHDVPSHDFDTFERDISLLLERLRAAGVSQVVAVDLSRSGWPMKVLRVLAPGLEAAAYLPGYKPGRRAERHRSQQNAAGA